MDSGFVHRAWEKWASKDVGSSGEPSKAALLINYDPSGPSRLLATIAEQEGIKADPVELREFVNFVNRNKFQMESFIIGLHQCMMAQLVQHLALWLLLISLHGSWIEEIFNVISPMTPQQIWQKSTASKAHMPLWNLDTLF
ncbi:uncharacterized protein LOC120016835 isoform X2 [Tripterygium wilfordii]|uniref:uncharacterized protein LOC120016835 isoform X2 n=1 Tax=Tripterygium wilfordii TaxID=458696 RepID=UPI0018F80586|nr:uncharacterized protein LOC120016835 isoform X2 [Tripterygium wilfordii]